MGDRPGTQAARDRAVVIRFQESGNRGAIVAGGQHNCAGPAALADRRHQLFGALGGETIISGAQASASPLALMLETDAPIWAFNAVSIRFDADGPKQVESPFSSFWIANLYATLCFHTVPRYAKP